MNQCRGGDKSCRLLDRLVSVNSQVAGRRAGVHGRSGFDSGRIAGSTCSLLERRDAEKDEPSRTGRMEGLSAGR
jgi:hypothetical protein